MPELYEEFLRAMDASAGIHIQFRLSETPVFLPKPLLDKMVRYGRELYEQLAANPDYRKASDAAIPAQFNVPDEPEHPLFVQADFGLIREEDGTLEPKLVEIQGFPSIYALQITMAEEYQRTYHLNETVGAELSHLLDHHTHETFVDSLRCAILNGHAPEEVILLEIDPYEQKTAGDFLVTQRLLGIKIASLTDVRKEGRKLYCKGVPIKRIYNRVIADELVRKDIQPAFRFTDDLDVEWAGHPNWFFRLSKFSLPYFQHPSVPPTKFLSDLSKLPDDLTNYVLKPLYSFAGLGVKIGPTKEEIESIPQDERHNFILQEKMNFIPTINTPSGPTKVEIRIMYIHNGVELKPVTTVIRTGRGKMMGVDFNKNLDWIGASAGFYVRD
ncbi:MAG: hypothetical protein JOZ45_13405 [Acidobacteriaceae bacterium]|nr:hypothetical protein [Acidobacteriaceae bacterium]